MSSIITILYILDFGGCSRIFQTFCKQEKKKAFMVPSTWGKRYCMEKDKATVWGKIRASAVLQNIL